MELYEPIHERFSKYCEVKTSNLNLAKDLVNDTILIAYTNFDKIKRKEAMLYFLFGTAHRVFLNQIRKKKPELNNDVYLVERDKIPDKQLEIVLLYESINSLDSKYGEVILLKEISGFSIKEIAAMKKLSESAVKVRLHRAKQKLKNIMNIYPVSHE